MALTPLDIHNKEFNVKMRGYDQDQVNDFLDQIIKDYEAALKQKDDLQTELKASEEKVTYFNQLKDALNQSIIVAQEAADKVKTNAQKEADIINQEAQKNAQNMLNEATEKSNRILADASEKAKQIAGETEDLKKQTRVFRQRLQVMLESQLEIVKSKDWDELLAHQDQKQAPTLADLQQSLDNATDSSVNSSATGVLNESTVAAQEAGSEADRDTMIIFPNDDKQPADHSAAQGPTLNTSVADAENANKSNQ
ncbi:DivIVA domain-containing protein [Loigolactobacillus bifermentans]|jgi:cell division initiation protein|uniref:Cell-division initiation protein (Septum placement) n=1 Tax=Loigolactobacillus bifermentans DSM 20003 TaxID=1423726 RepID=A0A0R1H2N2_9LACO|nr:DivIVA domain-containing protein [Loigolactobacillus bifermentans]KRK40472.1 cell-division initiation protein (septum placement) [Loigolactobacillus bifermentans DSM 20003]QGG59806.1 DivIVA domain-containing protein [Loigolactobacillus bifermentans]